jgi:dTMP kinase
MIVAIEGCDASGKHTQSVLLAEALKGAHYSFPQYNGPFGATIKGLLTNQLSLCCKDAEAQWKASFSHEALALQALMYADRYEAAQEIVAQSAKRDVVLDRYWQSGYCYGIEDGLDADLLLRLAARLPPADMNIYLDVPVDVATFRRPEARDRYEKDKAKLQRVRQRYLALWEMKAATEDNWIVVDGKPSVEEVHLAILNEHLAYQARRNTLSTVGMLEASQLAELLQRLAEPFFAQGVLQVHTTICCNKLYVGAAAAESCSSCKGVPVNYAFSSLMDVAAIAAKLAT